MQSPSSLAPGLLETLNNGTDQSSFIKPMRQADSPHDSRAEDWTRSMTLLEN